MTPGSPGESHSFPITGQKGEQMSEAAKMQKQQVIDEIKAKLDGAAAAVIIDYMGTTVAEVDEMRKTLREANIEYSVYKNTLMKRAVAGTEFEPLTAVMEGPSAIAVSKSDATAPARVLKAAIKKYNKMAFKGGVVDGDFYDADGIVKIADIPSREELIAKFLGSIQSPVSSFARLISEIAKAQGGEAPAEAPAEA